MPRLFSAIEIPSRIAERFTLLRAGLSGAPARDFTHALGEVDAAPFELRLNGLGSFGGRKPRAIFAEVAPSEALEALRRANERAAREAGLPPEGRPESPCRVRRLHRGAGWRRRVPRWLRRSICTALWT